jgi:hypothetical protein
MAQLEQGRLGLIKAPLNYYSIVVLAADTMALQQWNTRWLTGHQKGHNQIQKAASGYTFIFTFIVSILLLKVRFTLTSSFLKYWSRAQASERWHSLGRHLS